MAKTFKLEIVTPERCVIEMDASSVIVPGSEGYLGILADHAPLIAELTLGKVAVKDEGGSETALAIGGGFMEVRNNVVRILADSAELAVEIDVTRAQEAVKRAEERLQETAAHVDRARADAALERAINRLRVARGE